MAGTRTERIGSIFTRVSALIRSGAMKEENLPLWYNIYKAFPPKYEPSFNRKPPTTQIQEILYPEDHIRAKFHKDVHFQAVNLKSQKVSKSQIFLTMYDSILQNGVKEEEAYDKALECFKAIFSQEMQHIPSPNTQTNNNTTQTKEE